MHQLSLFIIIVVISGALCEDAVVLMAECPRTKLLNMDPKGKVHLSPEGPPTPNITLGGRIITTADGKIKALTTLYFKSRQRYLCFDPNGKLRGELQLTDRCYFLEKDVRGKYQYRLWQNEKLVVQFRRKGGNPPCSEFHKINSKKYHAVPSPIRASARTSFPNDINNNNSSNNRHKHNNSLSTIGGSGTSSNNSGESRHRHRHGSQRKQVERRRSHQRSKELGVNDPTALVPAAGQQNGGGNKHMPRDRSKMGAPGRRKHNRGKKHRHHQNNRQGGLALTGPSAPASQEQNQKPDHSIEIANVGQSIANKEGSASTGPRHRNGKRRSYSNVHDEYSNDEPSAINERPIQNSLTDFPNPSAKKYHIRNWITSSSSSSGSLSSISDANADRIHKSTNSYNKNSEDEDADSLSSSKSSSISPSSSRSRLISSIASSQSPPSHMKKYYQNKTAHYKSPAVLKPDKMRRLRNRPTPNNDNSN
ncbi:unnamed protein product [Hermetia illucens]|uniref:Fibroblast growth factor n=1 Tax=Hermetia illucens TaxID=343691 RepID=A0A7R8Z0L3_HERIL|nr:GATA zinc finger domain-containing protein 14 isoform X2 [Hermetia illucens]CAD7088861.1 unnamed protein product [Hermetia illucens]